MKRTIECILIGIFSCAFCNAQQAISTAGGEGIGTGGTVSYTVGQVVYTTNNGDEGTVFQGVQQPYEISVIPTGEDKIGINPELSVYPNPAKDYLLLKVKDYTPGNLSYQLFDMNGKLLENKKLEGYETIIQMDNLARSVYFLKVTDNDAEVKTFKIVKN
jgi:hypothetical protein